MCDYIKQSISSIFTIWCQVTQYMIIATKGRVWSMRNISIHVFINMRYHCHLHKHHHLSPLFLHKTKRILKRFFYDYFYYLYYTWSLKVPFANNKRYGEEWELKLQNLPPSPLFFTIKHAIIISCLMISLVFNSTDSESSIAYEVWNYPDEEKCDYHHLMVWNEENVGFSTFRFATHVLSIFWSSSSQDLKLMSFILSFDHSFLRSHESPSCRRLRERVKKGIEKETKKISAASSHTLQNPHHQPLSTTRVRVLKVTFTFRFTFFTSDDNHPAAITN